MGHETFSMFCDEPWNFVEEFRMSHQNVLLISNHELPFYSSFDIMP